MKPTLDTRVQGALETAENLENATSGAASRLAYSLRQQLDEIVDEVGRITYEYGVEYKYLTNRPMKEKVCNFEGETVREETMSNYEWTFPQSNGHFKVVVLEEQDGVELHVGTREYLFSEQEATELSQALKEATWVNEVNSDAS